MFRSYAQGLKFMLEPGMKVVVSGSVNLYAPSGTYQIYVTSVQPDGIGALHLAYEQLKERLCAEGLFSEEHKLPIPEYPERVGVITSPTGAAVRDIINVISRRFPLAKIYLYPALVQGEGSESSLIKALDYFDNSALCDVVIIGRGGGSIEDLWSFNSEALARKIYSARVPVISAVGHETDFTICDFVADLRAPTPSAAAELAVPDARELLLRLSLSEDRAVSALRRRAERAREKLSQLSLSVSRSGFEAQIDRKRRDIELLLKSSTDALSELLGKYRTLLSVNAEKLTALSPLATLTRGYAIAERGGEIIRSVSSVSVGDDISVILSGGRLTAEVKEKSREEKYKV